MVRYRSWVYRFRAYFFHHYAPFHKVEKNVVVQKLVSTKVKTKNLPSLTNSIIDRHFICSRESIFDLSLFYFQESAQNTNQTKNTHIIQKQ